MESQEKDPRVEAAAKIYVYGYPMVVNLEKIKGFLTNAPGAPVSGPMNRFAYARELLEPGTRFVSPNNDTLYIIAVCDVRANALALHVPDTSDRYYVLQFVDAWTNNFAYIGRRATGTAEGDYLVVPWEYAGPVPDGMDGVVRVPGGLCAIVGRIQVNSAGELPEVHRLQDGFTLTPAADQGTGEDAGARAGAGSGAAEPSGGLSDLDRLPRPDTRVGEDLLFWEKLRVAMSAFPPPPADAEIVKGLEDLGARPGDASSPFVEPDSETARVLVEGEEAGKAQIEAIMRAGMAGQTGGWSNTLHLFDYNLDYMGMGTIDSPEWRIDDRPRAYLMRAIGARAGLWGNHGYEAAYYSAFNDADGNRLNGANRYELRLDRQPPVDAFWSVTMYDTPEYYLVANPIDRYSIGDRTPGLQVADDGSLTIYMQESSPGPDKASNWLPAPPGDFRPTMRMYQPAASVLEGKYVLPAIRRVV